MELESIVNDLTGKIKTDVKGIARYMRAGLKKPEVYTPIAIGAIGIPALYSLYSPLITGAACVAMGGLIGLFLLGLYGIARYYWRKK